MIPITIILPQPVPGSGSRRVHQANSTAIAVAAIVTTAPRSVLNRPIWKIGNAGAMARTSPTTARTLIIACAVIKIGLFAAANVWVGGTIGNEIFTRL